MRSVTLLDQIVLEFLADPQVTEPPPRPKKKKSETELALGKLVLNLHRLRAEVHSTIKENPKISAKRAKTLVSAYDVAYFGIAGVIARD